MIKILKSHFWYSKSQRNGILLLGLFLFLSQVMFYAIEFSHPSPELDAEELQAVRLYLDSISASSDRKVKVEFYPFNPNFISDFKGYQLGLSVDEIDRLHSYRKKGKFVNSASEFQKVTQVSDSLLSKISPSFKFPEWVKRQNKVRDEVSNNRFSQTISNNTIAPKTSDLNKATKHDLMSITSINQSMAQRIVNYRNKLQGFSVADQLYEVWYIDSIQVKEILKVFQIESKPSFSKINLNTASFKMVLSIPYIDYDLCKKIFNYRDEVAELQSISELKELEGFPQDLYDRIVLYLSAE